MGSYNRGKAETLEWIAKNFKQGETCLDVGACDGKWAKLLNGYLKIDACEVFKPNIENYNLPKLYHEVFNCDIKDLEYQYYDLVIFGDIIEHLTVEDAQKVLNYAKDHCRDMIVAVPYLYYQDELYGNSYEKHLQPDLTPEVFEKRYGKWDVIWQDKEYCYYHCG